MRSILVLAGNLRHRKLWFAVFVVFFFSLLLMREAQATPIETIQYPDIEVTNVKFHYNAKWEEFSARSVGKSDFYYYKDENTCYSINKGSYELTVFIDEKGNLVDTGELTISGQINVDGQTESGTLLTGTVTVLETSSGMLDFTFDPTGGLLVENGYFDENATGRIILTTSDGFDFGKNFTKFGISHNFDPPATPEPSTRFLLASGCVGLFGLRKRRRRKA